MLEEHEAVANRMSLPITWDTTRPLIYDIELHHILKLEARCSPYICTLILGGQRKVMLVLGGQLNFFS